MPAPLTVIAGPPRSGKTDRLLARYRALVAENQPGVGLWLAPTWRAAAEVRRRLLHATLPGCFAPGVMTFEHFAEWVLQKSSEPIRPLSRLMRRHLIRQLIDEHRAADQLEHFKTIASTGGLVDLVGEWIAELKRLEIWPEEFRRAADARGIAPKDRELLDIYEAYQQRLREHHLYDAEGRFWSARDWLVPRLSQPCEADERSARLRQPWHQLRLVVADGFTDFTRTQHEILGILAGRAEEICISLLLAPAPAAERAELFDKPRRTLAELRRRHAAVTVEELPWPQPVQWPALAHLERTLFANPRQAQPAADTGGLEILAAASAAGEIEMIAAAIKRLLVEGDAAAGAATVRPGEIAVVFRQPQDGGGVPGEVLAAYGIPVAWELGPPLARAAAAAALVRLLQLHCDDWPLESLLALLGSNYFAPDWPEWLGGRARAEADRALRRWRIPQGRRQLLERLRSAAERAALQKGTVPFSWDEDRDTPRAEDVGGQSWVAAAVLERLAAAFDELPQRATLAAWGTAWQRLARQTGLLEAIQSGGVPGDQAAWDSLQAALRESDAMDRWLGREAAQLDTAAALAALLDILASQRLKPAADDDGRVRILSAESVRGLRMPYVFLAGLGERSFPSPQREDRLYSEAEYQRLVEQGLPLATRAERNGDEMLLFYQAVGRATRRLYFSYPALDGRGQPLLPSPYLGEVEQACGAGRIARTVRTDLSPVPCGEEPFSAAEFRVKAVAAALTGDVSLLAGLLQRGTADLAAAEGIVAGLMQVALRQDREQFGPAEGMLFGAAARRQLTHDFSPRRVYSATELEQYATCPFRYFLAKVLGVEAVEEFGLEVDYLERGRRAHELMAALHRRINQRQGRPASPASLEPEDYQGLLKEALDEVLGAAAGDPLDDALREVDRRLLAGWLADYPDQHARYDALGRECQPSPAPQFFEVSFGQALRGAGPPSTAEPLELGDGEQVVRIAGRIDRIDLGQAAGETVFNVLDYKTGGSTRFSVEAAQRGLALQLPLYAMAVVEVVLADRDCVPWQAGYWYLADDGFRPRQALVMYHAAEGSLEPLEAWEKLREQMPRTAAALVRGMREGQFPVSSADEDCTGRCPFASVCRINQIRSLKKTWQPAINND